MAKDKDLERVKKSINEPKSTPRRDVEIRPTFGGRPKSRNLPKGETKVGGEVRIRLGGKRKARR